jgi:hypothetical protein
METNIILFREGICCNIIRKEDHENSSGDHKFVILVDFLDHDGTATAEVY